MSLRFRMFVIIGSVFLLIFITAQLIESYITKKYIDISKQEMMDDIKTMNNFKQVETQKFVGLVLDYEQAETNALLNRITEHSYLRERYGPTIGNYNTQNWLSCAMLLGTNKRIDLIQDINEGKVEALIILDEPPPRMARKIEYEGDVPLFAMESEHIQGQWNGPYVGVGFNVGREYQDEIPPTMDPALIPRLGVEYYMLYSIEAVMEINVEDLEKKMKEIQPQLLRLQDDFGSIYALEDVVQQLCQSLKNARAFFLSRPDLLATLTSDNKQIWLQKTMPDYYEIQQADIKRLKEETIFIDIQTRYRQIEMIWQYATFIATGLFDFSPFNPGAPSGIAHIFIEGKYGEMIFKNDVFYSTPIGCIQHNCNTTNTMGGLVHIETFYEPTSHRLFFGNTASLVVQEKGKDNQVIERQGSLTIGINASRILKNLALAAHRTAFFATNNQILKGFNAEGKEISEYSTPIPVEELTRQKTGIITTKNGEEYFFLTLQPFADIDFYFFLLNPLDEEFALIKALDTTAQQILIKIKWQTQIIILVSLLLIILIASIISKHITAPLLLLSQATAKVREGKLDEISLPPMKKDKKDEVDMLYQSFYQMVEGLKEKEKVKGVLNKVVSPSIAEEILKGNVHLGGEEKVVTVLFADIRHFTELSEKMLPNEVIKMLNDCMTKISSVIDQYEGVIDKYVGDEVMALFGAPLSSENSAVNAVLCAIEMVKVLDEWNQQRTKEGLRGIKMGIGIHTGVVVAGNMGAENRLNYTVLGSNVNLAARLCSVSGEQQVLISKETLSQPYVREKVDYEELQPIELKGFSEPIAVYQIKAKKTPYVK
ncbi:MAG: HAMP domain-containing protein [Chlamydiales bacterium]|nr:HAMP domain-containing protein [Chlamydiales bacterium]